MSVKAWTERTVRAKDGAAAWLNAAIASSRDKHRRPLYRTMSVEAFEGGIQFVCTDGTMLFRSWVPYSDTEDSSPAAQPLFDEAPENSVVVLDLDRFAHGFMKTLYKAAADDQDLAVSIERVDDEEEPSLGGELSEFALTLAALGQRLSCPLYDGEFPDWRDLEFGLEPTAELVDGLALAPRIFAAVGKLKGVGCVDCSFHGTEERIEFSSREELSDASIRGLLMPMRRPEKKKGPATPPDAKQTSHG